MVVHISVADILLLPVLIGYTIWWTYDLRKGAKVHGWTLVLHSIVYGLAAFYVWAVSLGEIVLAGGSSNGVTWLWTLVLSAVGVAAAEVGIWYGEHRMVVERRASGGFAYRGPVLIAVFWLGLYLTRFGIEDGLLGGYSVFLPPGPGPPAGVSLGSFLEGVLVVASLYLVSFGFLLGITVSIWQKHRRSLESPRPATEVGPAVPSPPGSAAVAARNLPPAESSAPSGGPDAGSSAVGVVPCPACGQTWPSGTAFCGQCGRSLAPSPPQG